MKQTIIREYWTVKNLVDELSKFPEDVRVLISIDEEGNEYKDIHEVIKWERNNIVIFPVG